MCPKKHAQLQLIPKGGHTLRDKAQSANACTCSNGAGDNTIDNFCCHALGRLDKPGHLDSTGRDGNSKGMGTHV